MSTDGKEFQKHRLPWSRWKHAILIEYLKTMSTILKRAGTIYHVDGFAGPGRYIEDGLDGSPLLTAQYAKKISEGSKDYSLRCINIEADVDVFKNLENATASFKPLIENFQGDFGDYVNKILGLIGDQPTLFFLDPIGIKGLEWDRLLPIYQRNPTTEILLRFDAQTAFRLTGSATVYHKTFNDFIGEESCESWVNCQDKDNTDEKRECITIVYEKKLRTHFDYVARIPIKRSDDLLKYYLLFATRSLKGIQVMNDVLYSINDLRDRTLDEERRTRNELKQLDMFAPLVQDELLDELNELKAMVLERLKTGQEYRRDDLRAEIALINDNFGRFSGTHFTAVLGGRARKINVPKSFQSLEPRIKSLNGLTLGTDKVEIKLID